MDLLQPIALRATQQLDIDQPQWINIDGVIAQRLAKESFRAMAERDAQLIHVRALQL